MVWGVGGGIEVWIEWGAKAGSEFAVGVGVGVGVGGGEGRVPENFFKCEL